MPALGEPVIGVIVARHAEGYRVDIGSAQMAALDALAFEDATKRNKPNLKVGEPLALCKIPHHLHKSLRHSHAGWNGRLWPPLTSITILRARNGVFGPKDRQSSRLWRTDRRDAHS